MIQTDLVGFQVTDEEVVPDSVIGQRGSFRHLSGDVSQMTVQLCVLRCWNQRFTFAGIQVKYKDFNESINIIYNVSFLWILYFVSSFFYLFFLGGDGGWVENKTLWVLIDITYAQECFHRTRNGATARTQ